MKYFVYILINYTREHWYIGSTSNLVKRLGYHNRGSSKATKPYKPWEIAYTEEYNLRKKAVKRELYLKSPKGYLELLEIKRKVGGVG